MWENRKLYNPLSSETVSTFHSNENYIDCDAVNFLSSLLIPNRINLGSRIFLCLLVTLLYKNLYPFPSTKNYSEEILCLA